MLHFQRSMLETLHSMTAKASSHNQSITSNLVGAATIVLESNTWRPKPFVSKGQYYFELWRKVYDTQQDAEKPPRVRCHSWEILVRGYHFVSPAASFVIPRRFRDDFRHLDVARNARCRERWRWMESNKWLGKVSISSCDWPRDLSQREEWGNAPRRNSASWGGH